jgi:hypothetical protein
MILSILLRLNSSRLCWQSRLKAVLVLVYSDPIVAQSVTKLPIEN